MEDDINKQTTEVESTKSTDGNTVIERQSVATSESISSKTIIARVIWFIAGFILVFLILRVVLMLLGAKQTSGFVDFIYSVSGFLAAPFYGIFARPAYGNSVLDSASLVAIIVYTLIAWGIVKLVALTTAENRIDI